jgi:hypothetical protein
MRKISSLLCFFTLTIIIYSCSDKKTLEGDWDDNIKLSTKLVEFDSGADSVIVTTKGGSWWITGVSVNNQTFLIPEDLNTYSNNYSFKEDCFVIERRDDKTLFIKLDENTLSTQRTVTVGLQAGNYFDGVTIKQSAK